MPYHNCTFLNMLSIAVSKCEKDWDLHLFIIMLAYCSSIQETTGITPFRLIFGREVKLSLVQLLGHLTTLLSLQPMTICNFCAEIFKMLMIKFTNMFKVNSFVRRIILINQFMEIAIRKMISSSYIVRLYHEVLPYFFADSRK